MRIIREIAHPQFKITLMGWNEKYILKIEAGPYEQTYKIAETQLSAESDIDKLLTDDFLTGIEETFKKMHADLRLSLERLD